MRIAIIGIVASCSASALTVQASEAEGDDKPISTGLAREAQIDDRLEGQRLGDLEKTLRALQEAFSKQGQKLNTQEHALADQARVIAAQKRELEDQSRELETLRDQILSADVLLKKRGAGALTQVPPERNEVEAEKQPVGQAPMRIERRFPVVPTIPELGGVLTPRGWLVIEPALQYSHSSINRFSFLGVEILNTFLIGLLQAEDVDRNLFSPQVTARYGVTDRLELEAKVPYVFRDDRFDITIPQVEPEDVTFSRNLEANGIGDIEIALHYQINRGLNGWPFFVGNLRYKTDTGEGPFDVARDERGIETELSTGSGFQAFEPSVTILFPSDPVVFFANIGYLFHFSEDVDQIFGDPTSDTSQAIGTVDPGDALRISVGMAYSLNERASFSLGYKHDVIEGSDFEINNVDVSASKLHVGVLTVGWGYSINDRVAINLNLEMGVTDDAPDVLMTLRVPIVTYKF